MPLSALWGEVMAARSLKYLAPCLSALFGAQGCTDDGVSLHVICPIFPELEDNVCTYDPSGEGCLLDGLLNLAAPDPSYRMSLRVESGLKARAREVPPMGEPNGIQLRSAEVELRLPSGERLGFDNGVGNPFEVVASGYIPPEGLGAITFVSLRPEHAAQLILPDAQPSARYPQIVVAVKLKGKTNGDQEVIAGEYAWPVRLMYSSLQPADNLCQNIDYCEASLGQDLYARACER